MHTIIPPTLPARRTRRPAGAPAVFRTPLFDTQPQDGALLLTVYVPGVEAIGVEIAARGPDLTITARKTHFVRVNWTAAHFEGAQRDYQLRLRLGAGYDFESLHAEIHDGVLTLLLPARARPARAGRAPLSCVA